MKKIDIKGKPYVMVNERIKAFRKDFEGWSLTSEIIELSDERVVMKATISDEQNEPIATGHAFEDKQSSFINKTSFIENCETSAWGRALANLGIGIDESIASAEEVVTAIKQQNDKPFMNQAQFDTLIKRARGVANLNKRQELVRNIFNQYRMKNEYKTEFQKLTEL